MTAKPKRKKRYTSREMILKDIEAARRKRNRLITKSDYHTSLAELASGVHKTEHESERDRLNKMIDRLDKTRLPRLGKTLAMFDTVPLGASAKVEGLDQEGVVLQGIKE